jgi:hypothetical protein
MEMFNEMSLMVCFTMSYCFTEFVNDAQLRYTLGWGFVGIMFGNIAVNFGGIVITMIKVVGIKLKKNYKAYKSKRMANKVNSI